MKNKSSVSFYALFLPVFLLGAFSQTFFAQKNGSQNTIIRFVNRNDEDGATTRPRVFNSQPAKVNSDDKPANNNSKAATNAGFEHRVFELINKKRMESGLTALVWNDDVAGIARVHSENMANNKFFDHAGLDGKMVNNRADAAGLTKWRSIGENIAYNRGYAAPLEFVVESWMKSAGHRENILNTRWQESGIGIAIAPDGTYYFTEVFLMRK